MECLRVVLLMKEEAYGQALAKALGDLYPQLSLQIVRKFPQGEGVLPDLLVTDISLDGCSFPKEKTIILVDIPAEQERAEGDPCYLYRHLGARRMGAELLLLGQGRGSFPLAALASHTKAAGFLGGRGKTSLALSTAGELASYHRKKVLYLSFEEWPSPELYIPPDPAVRSLGDYLYYLFSGRHSELTGALEPFLLRDPYGVETFSYSGGRNEIKELSREELAVFMQDLWERRRYDYILLDFGEELSEPALYLTGLCRKLFCLRDGSPGEMCKAEKLCRRLFQVHGNSFEENLVWVRNFWDPESSLEEDEVPVEYDPSSFIPQDGYWHISLSRSLGTGVRKIVDRLEGWNGGPLAERNYQEGEGGYQFGGSFADG